MHSDIPHDKDIVQRPYSLQRPRRIYISRIGNLRIPSIPEPSPEMEPAHVRPGILVPDLVNFLGQHIQFLLRSDRIGIRAGLQVYIDIIGPNALVSERHVLCIRVGVAVAKTLLGEVKRYQD
jgi:hypothetical protein